MLRRAVRQSIAIASVALSLTGCSTPPGPSKALTFGGRRVVSVVPWPGDELPYGASNEVFHAAYVARCNAACEGAKRPGESLVACEKLDAAALDAALTKTLTERYEVYVCGFGGPG